MRALRGPRAALLRAGRLVTALALGAAAWYVPAPPARAQEEPQLKIRLQAQPPWHGPGSRLRIRVGLANTGESPLDGLHLRVAAHPRITSRSNLHSMFEGEAGFQTSSYTIDLTDERIAPGTALDVRLDDRIARLPSVASSPDGGVFPVTITAFDSELTRQLGELVTPLIFYPSPPGRPLNVVVVLPVSHPPVRDAQGVFRTDDEGVVPLEDALDEGRWLEGLVDALERHVAEGLNIAVAPSPRMLDEIGDLAGGYVRDEDGEDVRVPRSASTARAARDWIARFSSLVDSPNVTTLLMPYSSPDLPLLARRSDDDWIASQIATGHSVLEQVLGEDVDRDWVLPPGGRLDAVSVERLRLAGSGEGSFVAGGMVRSPEEEELETLGAGCASPTLTFGCPITVATSEGSLRGYVADDDMQTRIGEIPRGRHGALALQRLYAETAMVHLELPGTERIVMLMFPSSWRPSRTMARRLFRGITRAPWLRTLEPEAGLTLGLEEVPVSLIGSADLPSGAPSEEYLDAIGDAERLVDAYAAVGPPDDFVQRFRRNLLTAQSSLWWEEDDVLLRGGDYIGTTAEVVQRELDKIRIGGAPEITLTSERGDIQFSLVNAADYPVTVAVDLQSRDLVVAQRDPLHTLEPGVQTQVSVPVASRSSGIFPVQIRVLTPDSAATVGEPYLIESYDISVRSTTFNDIALAITIGALGFLVLFYVVRAIRQRGDSRKETPGVAPH